MNEKEGTLAVTLPWHITQWQHVINLHNSNKLPHAILLSGMPGIGKKRFALSFAQYILCLEPENGTSCGKCRQCLFNKAGTHPDLKVLEPEDKGKQLKVDQIRQLVDFFSQTSQQGGYKVAVLAPAENMNSSAANALLKNLEEPGPDTLILLVSDSPSRLLPTIRSRCQLLNFPTPEHEKAVTWLKSVISTDVDIVRILKDLSGRPLSALELIESDGVALRDAMSDDFLALVKGSISPISLAEKWLQSDLSETLVWLNNRLLMVVQYKMAAIEIDQKWVYVAKVCQSKQLFVMCDKILFLRNSLTSGTNPNKQLALEALMLEISELFSN